MIARLAAALLPVRIVALRAGIACCGWLMGEVNLIGVRWCTRLRDLEARR